MWNWCFVLSQTQMSGLVTLVFRVAFPTGNPPLQTLPAVQIHTFLPFGSYVLVAAPVPSPSVNPNQMHQFCWKICVYWWWQRRLRSPSLRKGYFYPAARVMSFTRSHLSVRSPIHSCRGDIVCCTCEGGSTLTLLLSRGLIHLHFHTKTTAPAAMQGSEMWRRWMLWHVELEAP